MFETVVAPTDLSPASDKVLSCLHGLRTLGTERIVLTHALGIRHLHELRFQLAPLAEPKLNEQRQLLERHGFAVEVAIASGTPSWEIVSVARQRRAAMIVIGSHGATLAREVLLGSVALEVAHQSDVPVLVAQLRITDDPLTCEAICSDLPRHVLFPTDFSEIAERAFGYLEEIVRRGRRHVTLVHVQDKSRIYGDLERKLEDFNRIDRQRLERMGDRLTELGANAVRIEIPYGQPKEEIIREVERNNFSLVVMGTQGRGFFGETFLGSVAYHVVRRTLVPTLLVPPVR